MHVLLVDKKIQFLAVCSGLNAKGYGWYIETFTMSERIGNIISAIPNQALHCSH